MKSVYQENYNSPTLVDMWADFVDWEKRRKGEDGFIKKRLLEHDCKTVLDASLGDGCDSIYLLKSGFDVTSNEIDSLFIQKAVVNARKAGVELKITEYDWRDFGKKFPAESFDCVYLMGNSLNYLFNRKDLIQVLEAFRGIIRKGGVLLIDQRNYDYMLAEREKVLAGNFRYSKKHVYCGDKVRTQPVEIKDNKIVMKYEHEDGKRAFLVQYPYKKGELLELLQTVGFKDINQYSDYSPGYNYEADFFEFVAVK